MSTPTTTQLNPQDRSKLKAYLAKSVRSAGGESDSGRDELRGLLQKAYARTQLDLDETQREALFSEVLELLALGRDFGPIQPLLDDPSVSEIMVNGPKSVFVEREGRLTKTEVQFADDDDVLKLIQSIVLPLGRRIDADKPAVDARLPDGSRVNAIIPPVAIDGPALTIRKFAKERLGVKDLIGYGSLNATMAEFLKASVGGKLNILISGGTGSGKTTLLNMLSSFIPGDERIVTIEDAAELQLQQEHVVRLETKPPNPADSDGMSVRSLVRNALRMRPDRIVVGEVRGGEALDMLQAMNTGHDGSLTTLHANSPRDAISRLETMVLMAGMELPLLVARQQIAAAVDLIVQQSRLPDGSRKITHITEVGGMEGDTVVMSDIFRFEQSGIDPNGKVLGELQPTGIRPIFMQQLEYAGFNLTGNIFMRSRAEEVPSTPRRR